MQYNTINNTMINVIKMAFGTILIVTFREIKVLKIIIHILLHSKDNQDDDEDRGIGKIIGRVDTQENVECERSGVGRGGGRGWGLCGGDP